MASEFVRPNKSFALFVYNSEFEKEADAKQVVLNESTGEFMEVASTNQTMIRIRVVHREAMDKIVQAMMGVYKEPNRLVVKEINAKADDFSLESGPIVYLPGDRQGASRIMSILTHTVATLKKTTEQQVRDLKSTYIMANRNVLNINHALSAALREVRHG